MKGPVVSALRWRDFALALWRYARAGSACSTQFKGALALLLEVDPASLFLFGSGRAALHTFVASLGLGPQDEVLLPGYTCVVVPNVFEHLGLPVRYVDIAHHSFNPDPDKLASAIGPHTRLVLLPHNFGLGMSGVAALRQRFSDVVFVEDAAHALGSRDARGALLGTLAQAAFFSFEFSKCLSTGLGGVLVVNDVAMRQHLVQQLPSLTPPSAAQLARQWLTLAWHRLGASLPGPWLDGLQTALRAPVRALGLVAQTPASELSGASRPDYAQGLHALSAALGLQQLAGYADLLRLRQAQARLLDELLAGSQRFRAPRRALGTVLLRYPLWLASPAERPQVLAELRGLDIVADTWFNDVVHPQGSHRYAYQAGMCPRGEATAQAVINLPLGLHAQLSAKQQAGLRAMAHSA